jgi:hypothetical protein
MIRHPQEVAIAAIAVTITIIVEEGHDGIIVLWMVFVVVEATFAG